MFKSVSRVSVLKCKSNDGLPISPRRSCAHFFSRIAGSGEKKTDITSEMNFAAFMEERRAQARRSLFVKYTNYESVKKFFTLYKMYGDIKKAYCSDQLNSQYLLIEMEEEECIHKILQKVYGHRLYGCSSQFIVLDSDWKNCELNYKEHDEFDEFMTQAKTCEYNSVRKVINGELSKKTNTLNDTIRNCFNALKINEFEIRKKFLMCNQIEKLCGAFMENYFAYPFGSSISGFGLNGGDLDIALLPDNFKETAQNVNFQCDNSSVTAKRHLGIIFDVMKNFSNWTTEIYFIKQARVPIVKFKNTVTNVECDLSIYNSHGLAMSQMYYALASVDWRIRALVVFFKLWASKLGLTAKNITPKPTGFSLSVLVLFFFQQINMLPPLNIFPCKDSHYLVEDKEEILSVLNKMKKKCKNNTKSPEDLFKEFLEFYLSFDFFKWGISLRDGKPVSNVDKYALYLENPIYEGVNISCNVRPNDVEDLQGALFDAVSLLKGESNQEQIRTFFNLSIKKRKAMNLFRHTGNNVQVC